MKSSSKLSSAGSSQQQSSTPKKKSVNTTPAASHTDKYKSNQSFLINQEITPTTDIATIKTMAEQDIHFTYSGMRKMLETIIFIDSKYLNVVYEIGHAFTLEPYLMGPHIDPKEPVRWIKLAAEYGHSESQKLLGNWYSSGMPEYGIAKDAENARHWYNLAKRENNSAPAVSTSLALKENLASSPTSRSFQGGVTTPFPPTSLGDTKNQNPSSHSNDEFNIREIKRNNRIQEELGFQDLIDDDEDEKDYKLVPVKNTAEKIQASNEKLKYLTAQFDNKLENYEEQQKNIR